METKETHIRGATGDMFPVTSLVQTQLSLPDAFKRIYYHLYTNSKASRAELIIEDLSLLLLSKLAAEMNGDKQALVSYLDGHGTANKLLLPLLRKSFSELLDAKQVFALGDSSLRMALAELAELDLSHAPAHVLGEAFQALIGPRLRGERGQFFTPKSLVRAMVEITDPKPDECVADPACGTGGFLVETQIYQEKKYPRDAASGRLVGVDKDTGLARLSGALLKILSRGRARVYDFNSLLIPEWQRNTGAGLFGAYDVILTNPPFGARIGVKDESILSAFDFGHAWVENKVLGRWMRTGALCGSEDPQILFLELCVRALKPGGRLGIVLPEGVFGNKQTAYVWDWLEEQGAITALLDCPRTTFQPGTDTKTNVLFFTKDDEREQIQDVTTRIAVALRCGHDRRGRSHCSNGDQQPDDFPAIAAAFRSEDTSGELWRSVSLRGHRYLVPRYYNDRGEESSWEQDLTQGAHVTTLKELIRDGIISIKKGHEVGSYAYGTGNVPFVRTSDLSNLEISTDPTKAVSEQIYSEFARQQNLQIGDLLVVVDGRYRIGATALLTAHNARCVVQSHLRIISTLERNELDPYELLYALNLPSVRLRVRSLVFIQSTLGTLGARLLELRVPILHGDGPWSNRITQFRETLQHRATLLSDLQAMSGPEFEL